jgi:hypothetical protein
MKVPAIYRAGSAFDFMFPNLEKHHSLNRIEVLDFTLRTFASFALNDLDSI